MSNVLFFRHVTFPIYKCMEVYFIVIWFSSEYFTHVGSKEGDIASSTVTHISASISKPFSAASKEYDNAY